MDTLEKILNHPENQYILDYIGREVILDFANFDTWSLGTHPDLMDKFWELGNENSPEDVNPKVAIGNHPALVNPESGIIYGFAGGTRTHVLRLPRSEREKAIKIMGITLEYSTKTIDLKHYGDKWAFIDTWNNPKIDEWHRLAYDYADS